MLSIWESLLIHPKTPSLLRSHTSPRTHSRRSFLPKGKRLESTTRQPQGKRACSVMGLRIWAGARLRRIYQARIITLPAFFSIISNRSHALARHHLRSARWWLVLWWSVPLVVRWRRWCVVLHRNRTALVVRVMRSVVRIVAGVVASADEPSVIRQRVLASAHASLSVGVTKAEECEDQ